VAALEELFDDITVTTGAYKGRYGQTDVEPACMEKTVLVGLGSTMAVITADVNAGVCA
jgi:hypothetical protein